MEISYKEALQKSIALLDSSEDFLFREFDKAYFSTTENIASYIEGEQFQKNRALTVLASGDHVFNLIHEGVREVDAFDVNKLEYFVYHLKRALIKALPYKSFIDFCNYFNYLSYFDEVKEVINKVKPYMKEDVYQYFRKLLEYLEKHNLDLMDLYYDARDCGLERANPYLHTEEDYLKCRCLLDEVPVKLYFGDVRSIPSVVSGGYDVVLLSNIADYLASEEHILSIQEFRAYIEAFYRLLNPEGLIINYLYRMDEKYVIGSSNITKEDLGVSSLVTCVNLDDYYQEGYLRVRKVRR